MTSDDTRNTAAKRVYRPGLSSIDRLKKTDVGNQEIIAALTGELEECAGVRSPQHLLLAGPPGIGKTHLFKLLTDRIHRSTPLMNSYFVILFPVDNHRITSLVFLFLEIMRNLADDDDTGFWSDLFIRCSDESDTTIIEKELIGALQQKHQETGKRFLVLFENFDAFFSIHASNKENVIEFAEFLQHSPIISFIGSATTPVLDDSILSADPFRLFKVTFIKELSLAQTRKLLYKNLKYDQQTELLSIFEDLSPKIQALHELTGGNPRLVLLLYELLVEEETGNINTLFEDLLDRVTPYYQDRIRSLSPLDRALLSSLASMRGELTTQARLAESLRISSQQCRLMVARLVSHGLLDSRNHPTNKRSKIYRIKEGFFDLWMAIGQLKNPNEFLPLLFEFLEKWYSDKVSREKKREQIWLTIRLSGSGEDRLEIEKAESLLRLLSKIGDDEEKKQNQLEFCYYLLSTGRKKQARQLLKSIGETISDDPVFTWVIDHLEKLLKGATANGFIQQLLDLFDCWKLLRTGNANQLVTQALKVSGYFVQEQGHELNISFLSNTIRLLDADIYRLPLLARIAGSQEKTGRLDDAINSWNQVLKIADENQDQKSRGTTLNNLSQIYQDQGNYEQALQYLEQALEILEKINDYDGQSTSLNNMATVYFAQGYYEKALEYFERTLAIIHFTDDLPLKAITLSNISFIHKVRGDYDTAIEDLEESLTIMKRIGNRKGEATTLLNISQIYGELGNLEQCFQFFLPAYHILETLGEADTLCKALLNLGKTFWQHDNREMAESSWQTMRTIAKSHQLDESMQKLDHLLNELGISELNSETSLI